MSWKINDVGTVDYYVAGMPVMVLKGNKGKTLYKVPPQIGAGEMEIAPAVLAAGLAMGPLSYSTPWSRAAANPPPPQEEEEPREMAAEFPGPLGSVVYDAKGQRQAQGPARAGGARPPGILLHSYGADYYLPKGDLPPLEPPQPSQSFFCGLL